MAGKFAIPSMNSEDQRQTEVEGNARLALAVSSVEALERLGWDPDSVRYLATAFALNVTENLAAVLERAQQIFESSNFEKEFVTHISKDSSVLGPALDASRFTSADELRDLLGRILAGEVDKPGSFSRQTVSIAQNLTTENLHEFLKIRAVSWEHVLPEEEDILLVMGKRGNLYGQKFLSVDWETIGVSFHSIGEFQHLGLLQERLYGALALSYDGVWRLRHGGRTISIRAHENDSSLPVGMYIPTRAGKHILGLFLDEDFSLIEGYFEEVCKYWHSRGFEIEEQT